MRYFIAFLLLSWTLFSWQYYVCKIKKSCWWDAPPSTSITSNAPLAKPLKFRWSSYQIPLDSGFPDLREEIIAQQGEGKVLHITGHYFLPENNENSSYDLGMARAEEVKKMLLSDFSEDRIKTFTALAPLNEIPTDSFIEAVRFEWVASIDDVVAVEESETMEHSANEVAATEENEKEDTTISNTNTDAQDSEYFVKYFPYNQTKMPAEFAEFLDELAQRILEEDKKVVIRGHTDSSGDSEMNFKVGLRRAKKIRDQLIERGVAKRNIETTSDGEDEPIASNKTEEGRKQNRRIEIILK